MRKSLKGVLLAVIMALFSTPFWYYGSTTHVIAIGESTDSSDTTSNTDNSSSSSSEATLDNCEHLDRDTPAYEACRSDVQGTGDAAHRLTTEDNREKCNLLTPEAQEAAGCNGNEDLISVIITNILYSVIAVSGLVSVVFIVIGGIKYISSQGSPETVQEGKRTLLYATIGLVVTSLAFVIVNFTINTIYNNAGSAEPTEEDPCGYLKPSEDGTGGNWTAYTECRKSVEKNPYPTKLNVKSSSCTHLISNENGASGDLTNYNECVQTADLAGYSGIGAGPGEEITNLVMLSQKRVYVGDEETLKVHVVPQWFSGETIKWSSDNPSIVSVDSKGKIKAKREGVANITAKSENGRTTTTTITATKPIEPEKIELDASNVELTKGKEIQLRATVYPTNATNKRVEWSTDNAAVATVNSRGQVTGKKEGTANITAKTTNGKTVTTPVNVTGDSGESIKITSNLLHELDYFYQTSHHEPIDSRCGANAGDVSCGPATYMVAVYVLTKQRIEYASFAREACGRWLGRSGAAVDALVTVYKAEYENKYHVRLNRLPITWDASVAELKKGHPVIYLVHRPSDSIINSQGYRLTNGEHYVIGLSYRNQGGGQIYIWSPVAETAAPGRNIGNCSEGACWYDRAAFERNINKAAWSVQKLPH